MTDIEKQIEAHIQKFVGELNSLVAQAAIQAVSDALGGTPARAAKPAPAAPKKAAPKKAAPKAAPKKARKAPKKAAKKKARSGRRTREELEAQQEALVGYIADNPGEPMERIAKALGVTSAEMNRPISKLLDEGRVRREGQRRASRYFVKRGGKKRRSK